MPTTQQLIRHFRACFEADNRVPQVTNFFGAKVKHVHLLPDADLLTGQVDHIVLPDSWGQEAAKTLQLYAKEKQLYLAAFFVFGSAEILGKKRKIIAPLLLYPASLEMAEEQYRVRLDHLTPVFNPAALLPLRAKNTTVHPFEHLSEILPGEYVRFEEGFLLREKLDDCFSNIDTQNLAEYPVLISPQDFEQQRKGRRLFKDVEQAHLMNSLALGVLERGKSGRGILNELQEIQEQTPSASLKTLLGANLPPIKVNVRQAISPKPLNAAQEQLIRKHYKHALSLVIGPPGTGKSFTIAALAIDAICRGESVLIAANTPTAVSVIANKLRYDFDYDPHAIETTDKYWKRDAKQFLENILQGMGVPKVSKSKRRGQEDRLYDLIKALERQAAIIKSRLANEARWTEWLMNNPSGWWRSWRLNRQKRRSRSLPGIWQLTDQYLGLLTRKNKRLGKYLEINRQYFLYQTLSRHRQVIVRFLKALRARTGSLKAERFAEVDFKELLQALPIWLVTPEAVSEVLPLSKEEFDLVIFDEATQCNIASALPLFQRAKRAVVVGDPKQLRHVSFLSRQRQQQLLQQQGLNPELVDTLDYRKLSLIDFVNNRLSDQSQVHFLNEHYRSHPRLIDFSNRHFYNNSLDLMTDRPGRQQGEPLVLHYSPGVRDQKGANPIEALSVLSALQDLITADADLPDEQVRSFGVLSPFREQSEALRNLIDTHLSLEQIQRHQIIVGTPYHFQGEERDVMLISLALDDDSHPSAYRYLDRADVFNVSITRARSMQQVFLSFDPGKRPANSLLRKYLTDAAQSTNSPESAQATHVEDDFLAEVVDFIQSLDPKQILTRHTVSGLVIDIIVLHGRKTSFIDLIGFPGDLEEAFPLERIKMFNRMGYQTFPLSYWSWSVQRKAAEASLSKFLR